jgi:transcription antitermination factor NusG
MIQWYCVQAKARQEFFACQQLKRHGWNPLLLTTVNVIKRRNGDRIESIISLFGSYFFIPFDINLDRWKRIIYTYGVKRILSSTPESPTPIPDDVMTSLLASRLEPTSDTPVVRIHPNCKARVIKGPLAGDNTIGIVEWTNKDRVGLLLDAMNGKISVEFHITALEMVS